MKNKIKLGITLPDGRHYLMTYFDQMADDGQKFIPDGSSYEFMVSLSGASFLMVYPPDTPQLVRDVIDMLLDLLGGEWWGHFEKAKALAETNINQAIYLLSLLTDMANRLSIFDAVSSFERYYETATSVDFGLQEVAVTGRCNTLRIGDTLYIVSDKKACK